MAHWRAVRSPGARGWGRVVRAPASLAALLALAAPLPAAGQEPDTAAAPRPFVEGGVYDRPFLARLLGRTAVGGYAEAHARLERVDGLTEELGFVARRFNLFTATQVSDFVRIGAELEVEEGGEEILVEFAAIDLLLHPALTVRAGMILSPLGRFNLAHDSPTNDFTDRPAVSTELLGVALSEPGIGVLGLVPVGARGRITWEAYAVNGFHDGLLVESGEGTRIPMGRGNVEDNNASPAVVARLAASPGPGTEVGLSVHHGAYNVYRLDGLDLDRRRDLTIGVLDVEGRVAGLRFAGEGALAWLDIPGPLRGLYAARQRGAYLEVLREFGGGLVATAPESFFTAGVRFDAVDFDADLRGDGFRAVTVGLNFRPTRDTAVKLDYRRGRGFDRFNTPQERAAVLLSVATYF